MIDRSTTKMKEVLSTCVYELKGIEKKHVEY